MGESVAAGWECGGRSLWIIRVVFGAIVRKR